MESEWDMTGKYEIEVYNKRVHYHLTVKRNITILQGNSATGKTELLRMIGDYGNNGISSGITIICARRCVVIENAFWKEQLQALSQCIIFIDEGASFLQSIEFTRMVKGSDNYFVLVTRDSLEQLPYSIEEIYGMRQERDSQKYKNTRKIYNETYQLYNAKPNEMKSNIFEYLLLKSELTGSTYHITEETYEYADSRKYFSWEEFYTDYLVQNTKDTIYQYSKKKLPLAYLTAGSMKRIQNQIPEKIIKAVKVRH